MGIREAVNKNSKLAGIATVAVLILVVGMIIWELRTSRRVEFTPNLAFFSDDDGKSFFADNEDLVPPFDHNGRQALRAFVFTSNSGKFVGYLQKYTEPERSQVQAARNAHVYNAPDPSGIFIKKPGDSKWINVASPGASLIVDVRCPDNPSQAATPVPFP
jgi:hypothetical protein